LRDEDGAKFENIKEIGLRVANTLKD